MLIEQKMIIEPALIQPPYKTHMQDKTLTSKKQNKIQGILESSAYISFNMSIKCHLGLIRKGTER